MSVEGGCPKSSDGNCVGMLVLSWRVDSPLQQWDVSLQPTSSVQSCPLMALVVIPPIPAWASPLSPGFHGVYLGVNYKDAADELIATFICLGAEVTIFTQAITISCEHTIKSISS